MTLVYKHMPQASISEEPIIVLCLLFAYSSTPSLDYSNKTCNFVPANLRRAILDYKGGAERGVQLHIGKCLLNALFLEDLNVGNSNLENKNIAEVDAAGGVYTHPVSVRCGGRTNFRTYTLRI